MGEAGEVSATGSSPRAWRRSLEGSEILNRFVHEMKEATGVRPCRDRAADFILGQAGAIRWPADPPDPRPARRVGEGDKVWVHNFASREIATYVVVGSDPQWDKGEVSRDSPFGHALLGAFEGEEREIRLPQGDPQAVRIVLIRRRGRS